MSKACRLIFQSFKQCLQTEGSKILIFKTGHLLEFYLFDPVFYWIPLLAYPQSVLKTYVIQVFLKDQLQNSPSSCRIAFLVKDSGTHLFIPSRLSPYFPLLFLVCCINHSLLPVLPLSNMYSLYQTIVDTARAIVNKCRALIFCVALLYTKSKSDSSTHTSVIYLQTLSTQNDDFPSLVSSMQGSLSYLIVSV